MPVPGSLGHPSFRCQPRSMSSHPEQLASHSYPVRTSSKPLLELMNSPHQDHNFWKIDDASLRYPRAVTQNYALNLFDTYSVVEVASSTASSVPTLCRNQAEGFGRDDDNVELSFNSSSHDPVTEGEHIVFALLTPKRYKILEEFRLTLRVRVNRKRVETGNNLFGSKGKLSCQACRRRRRKVQSVWRKLIHSVSTTLWTLYAGFARSENWVNARKNGDRKLRTQSQDLYQLQMMQSSDSKIVVFSSMPIPTNINLFGGGISLQAY